MLPRTLVGCSSKSYFGARQAAAWGPDVVDGVAGEPAGTDGLFICPSFPLIPTLLQGFAAQQFHGDEILAFVLAYVVDGADVGMVKR